MEKREILELLRKNVVPALGCTEPVCVALAAADAAKTAGGNILSIHMELSPNIYKNGVSVGIAGFDAVGLDYAAALGSLIQDTSLGLEIMRGITTEIGEMAKKMVVQGMVHLTVNPQESGVYVRCQLESTKGTAVSVIRGGHTNLVLTEMNDIVLYQKETAAGASGGNTAIEKLKNMTIPHIRALVETLDEEEIAFLMDGVKVNQELADHGLKETPGVGIAKVLGSDTAKSLLGSGLMERVMVRVASATEARLDGCPLATMSSAGSGSKGIAVILPVAEVAVAVHAEPIRLLRGLAFAHLLNEYINAHVGKLSAICACATASATAASAAITWLLGGSDAQIDFAVRNMTGSITGMICDGGKVGCAMKLATAIGAAFLSAALALEHVGLRTTDGICAASAEDCIRNMGRISNPGMKDTDKEILKIMTEKLN